MIHDKFDLRYVLKGRICFVLSSAGVIICVLSAIIYAFTVNLWIGIFGVGLTLLVLGMIGYENLDDEEAEDG
jgi:hypothetical protein